MTSRRGCGLLAVLLLLGWRAAANERRPGLPERITLEEALKLLDERSPRTLAERALLDVAQAERLAAGTLPNPLLSYGGLRLLSGANTGAVREHQLIVEQPLFLFGQRGARRELAELNVRSERARIEAVLAERRLAVRQAFAALVARQEALRVLEENLADLRRVESIDKGRAAEGDRSQYDVLRIETEARSIGVEVMNAQADLDGASGRLAALLGFAGWFPRADGSLARESIPTELGVLWETAQRRRPSLAAVRERQAAARGGLALASRERWPVPALAAGPLFTREENGVSAFGGVSFPLPLFDRNQGALARASAEVAAQTLALDAETAEARAEIERARIVLLQRSEALAELESEVVERVPTLRRMAEDAYREGSGGILDLLDSFRTLTGIRLLHFRQLEEAKLAEEALVSAAGLDAL